mmetsp:Transcript_44903/g.108997  ORF Transcript_44903/g.108997 Transcript_44903/m.108997 type:complete len:97 (+) Transcript_44903:2453-2743(+)
MSSDVKSIQIRIQFNDIPQLVVPPFRPSVSQRNWTDFRHDYKSLTSLTRFESILDFIPFHSFVRDFFFKKTFINYYQQQIVSELMTFNFLEHSDGI